jgi:hypothetical protein
VAALFFDDTDAGQGHVMDAQGVVDWDLPVPGTDHRVGWSLQIVAECAPSIVDPRIMAPVIDAWGEDLPLPQAMQRAYEAIEHRAEPLSLSFDESRERLPWSPEGGWPHA